MDPDVTVWTVGYAALELKAKDWAPFAASSHHARPLLRGESRCTVAAMTYLIAHVTRDQNGLGSECGAALPFDILRSSAQNPWRTPLPSHTFARAHARTRTHTRLLSKDAVVAWLPESEFPGRGPRACLEVTRTVASCICSRDRCLSASAVRADHQGIFLGSTVVGRDWGSKGWCWGCNPSLRRPSEGILVQAAGTSYLVAKTPCGVSPGSHLAEERLQLRGCRVRRSVGARMQRTC